MGRRAERETRKQSPHVPAMGSRAFGLLAPSLQWPGPTHPTPASCEVEGEVWSAPWRWYSATTECFSSVQFSSVELSSVQFSSGQSLSRVRLCECLQTGKQKSYRKTTTPSYHSQVADKTSTRDRNRMVRTETRWYKVSGYWIKSEFLIKLVCD